MLEERARELGRLIGQSDLEEKAFQIERAFSGSIQSYPAAYTQFLTAVDFALGPSCELVVVGSSQGADTQAMMKTIRTVFSPNKVVLFCPSEYEVPPVARIAEFAKDYKSVGGQATVYPCLHHTCQQPMTDIHEVRKWLGGFGHERS